MRSTVALFALVAAAGCRPIPNGAAPTQAAASPRAAPVARPSPASATHPDRVLAREVLVAMSDFTDEACACPDAACVGAVQSRMSAWAGPRLARIQAMTPTDAENASAEALQVRMQGCLTKHTAPVMPLTGTVILSQLRGFTGEICACADAVCVGEVRQRMLAWAMANLDAMKDIDPTAEEDAEADRIDSELAACTARIEGQTP